MMQLVRRLTFRNTHRVPSIHFLGARHLIDSTEHQYMMNAPDQLPGRPVVREHHHHIDPLVSQVGQAHKVQFSKSPPSNVKFLEVAPLDDWAIDVINEGGVMDMAYLKVKPISISK